MGEYFTQKFGAMERLLAGNSLTDLFFAVSVGLATWFVLWIIRKFVSARYQRFKPGEHHSNAVRLLAYLVGNTKTLLFLALSIYAGQELLTLPPKLQHVVDNAVLIMILIQVGLWAGAALRFYLEIKGSSQGADRLFAGSLDIINFLASLLIWSLVILLALDNIGVNVTSLLAGLGIGGVAVALALQNVLGDLFASLSIALDKPFVVGDSLTIDTFVGKVEHIGIKTTRLRSETGEQIILSNADILKSRVRNFGRLPEQRVLATLRLGFETPLEKLEALPKLLEGIVRAQPHARFDRAHFKTIGETAYIFELAYFAVQPAANPLMDLQQTVNLRIVDAMRDAGHALANPVALVRLEQPKPADG
jgi:small-conductance mechanosensitive channel